MIKFLNKEELRQKILARMRQQQEDERQRKSRIIQRKLFALPAMREAKTILFYASFDGEVETLDMMRQAQRLGKTVALPRVDRRQRSMQPACVASLDHDLIPGAYGIAQPNQYCRVIGIEALDMVIVPGVAFDRRNNRLGRGQGYYDRFLADLSSEIPAIGLAFDFQMLDRLPNQQAHDRPVSCVLSN